MAGGIDPTSDRAAYLQIADALRESIYRGEVLSGSQLPSERTLMDAYGAARGTVRQAIATLQAEGLVDVQHGRGVFVRVNPPVRRLGHDRFARRHREAGKAAFLAEVEAEGRTPAVEVLQVGAAQAPPPVADRLGLRRGTKVLVRRRRYLADGQPLELATSYIPWSIARGTAMCEQNPGPGGIYARLEETGHRLKRFDEEVTARMPHATEAASLRLGRGIPVLALVRTAFDETGAAVEVCDTVMAADRYVLAYQLPAD